MNRRAELRRLIFDQKRDQSRTSQREVVGVNTFWHCRSCKERAAVAVNTVL